MNNEIWKDIEGYEGYYQISSCGRVKSLERDVFRKDGTFQRRKKETIKANKINSDGYYQTTLSVNGIDRSYRVHDLVARAFIEIPESYEKLEVNHIDCDRKNNNVDNLEWKTHKENIEHSAKLGHYKKRCGKDNPNYGNDTLKRKYAEHPELKMCCSRPKEQNGRCIPLIMKNIETNEELKFKYIGECCEYLISHNEYRYKLDSLRNTIKKYLESGKIYKHKYIFTYV